MTNPADRIDRYARRELTAAEARELAQESLDSPELFEELTDTALARTALDSRPRAANVVRFPRITVARIANVAAAALIVLGVLNVMKRSRPAPPVLTPALASRAKPGQPVLLASGLQADAEAPVFRSPEASSRVPQPAGSIVSIEDGLATINLGALDGLAKGSRLEVFRDPGSTQSLGTVEVTTVFRERARGKILEGRKIPAGGQVRVSGGEHLSALLEQVNALYARGDLDAARIAAERAAQWANAENVPPEVAATAFNTLAVLRLMRGDQDGAAALLNQAVAKAHKTDCLNNLGVLAELRGDRRQAESLYSEALRNAPAAERSAIENNLARARGGR